MSCKPTKQEILDWTRENKEAFISNFECKKTGEDRFSHFIGIVEGADELELEWIDIEDWGFNLPSDACTFSFNKGLDRSHRKRYWSLELTKGQIDQLELVKEVIEEQPYQACASFGQVFFSLQGCCGRLEVGILDKSGCEKVKEIIEKHSIPLIRDFSNK